MCEQMVPGLRASLALLSASLEAGQGALQPQTGRALSPPLLLLSEVVCVGAPQVPGAVTRRDTVPSGGATGTV